MNMKIKDELTKGQPQKGSRGLWIFAGESIKYKRLHQRHLGRSGNVKDELGLAIPRALCGPRKCVTGLGTVELRATQTPIRGFERKTILKSIKLSLM